MTAKRKSTTEKSLGEVEAEPRPKRRRVPVDKGDKDIDADGDQGRDPNVSAGELFTQTAYRNALLKEHKRLKYKDPPVLPPHHIIIHTPARNPPKRNADGTFTFEGAPGFHPNLSPAEILQAGAFGGTYFRDIYSVVTAKHYKATEVMKEFPKEWFKGLKAKQLTSQRYDEKVNKYGKKCGGDLEMWESSGWISDADPYGYFQWYCRFFQGRRCSDDKRQLQRANRSFSPTGRWRVNLFNKIIKANGSYKDKSISPVIRQTLLHWGYEPTKEDFESYKAQKG